MRSSSSRWRRRSSDSRRANSAAGSPAASPARAGFSVVMAFSLTSVAVSSQIVEVGVHHHVHQLAEAHARLPAEQAPGLRGVAAQFVDLGGAEVARIDLDARLPVELDARERLVEKVAHRARLAGGDDEVLGAIVLQ